MEPERPIEKLLRAFTKKRREQAGDPPGFDLHPATRRMLQGEVARRAPRPRQGNFFLRLFAPLRPRLAFVVGAAAVTVLVVALLAPMFNSAKSRSKLMVQKAAALRGSTQVAEQPATPPPATPPTATLIADNDSAANQKKLDVPIGEESKNQPASAPVLLRAGAATDAIEVASRDRSRGEAQLQTAAAGGSGGRGGSSVSTGATGTVRVDLAYKTETDSRNAFEAGTVAPARAGGSFGGTNIYSLAAAEPADRKLQFDDFSSAAAKAPATAPGGQFGGGGGGGGGTMPTSAIRFFALNDEVRPTGAANLNRQKFVQWNEDWANALERSNSAPVLTNFAVEQNGGAMRVVDSDGSVYDGFLRVIQGPITAISGRSATAGELLAKDAADKEKTFEAVQNYFFRVTGTNRSLKQNVVFSGNFLNLTNGAMFLPPAGTTAPGVRSQSAATPVVLQQLPLQNSLINGTIQINNAREIPIQATPAPSSSQR